MPYLVIVFYVYYINFWESSVVHAELSSRIPALELPSAALPYLSVCTAWLPLNIIVTVLCFYTGVIKSLVQQ